MKKIKVHSPSQQSLSSVLFEVLSTFELFNSKERRSEFVLEENGYNCNK